MPVDPECLKKVEELRRYVPVLEDAMDKILLGRHETRGFARQHLEKLEGLYEILVRPEHHRLSMELLTKAETLLEVFENRAKEEAQRERAASGNLDPPNAASGNVALPQAASGNTPSPQAASGNTPSPQAASGNTASPHAASLDVARACVAAAKVNRPRVRLNLKADLAKASPSDVGDCASMADVQLLNRQTVMPKLQTRTPSPLVDELMDEAVVSVSPPKAAPIAPPAIEPPTAPPVEATQPEAIKPPLILDSSRQKLIQAMFVEKEVLAKMPQPPVIGSLRPPSRSPSRSPPMRRYRSHSRSRSYSPRGKGRPSSGGRRTCPSPRSRDSRRSSPHSGSSRSPSRASSRDSRRSPPSSRDSRRSPPSSHDSRRSPPSSHDSRRSPPSSRDSRRSPPSSHDSRRSPLSSRDSRRSPAKRKHCRRRSISQERGRNRSPPKTKRDSRHKNVPSPKRDSSSYSGTSHAKRGDSPKQSSLYTRREGERSPFVKDYSTENTDKSHEDNFNVDPLLSVEIKNNCPAPSEGNVWNRLGDKASDDEGNGDPDDIALVSRLEEVNDTELAELLNSVPDAFPHLRHLTPQQVKEKARSLLAMEGGDEDLSDLSDWSATTPSRYKEGDKNDHKKDKEKKVVAGKEAEERELTDISDLDMDELDLITNPKARSATGCEKVLHHDTNIDPKLLAKVSCSLKNLKIHKKFPKMVKSEDLEESLLSDIIDLDMNEIDLISKSKMSSEEVSAERSTKDEKGAGEIKTCQSDNKSDGRKSDKEVSVSRKAKELLGNPSHENRDRKEPHKIVCTKNSDKQATSLVPDIAEKASHHVMKKTEVAAVQDFKSAEDKHIKTATKNTSDKSWSSKEEKPSTSKTSKQETVKKSAQCEQSEGKQKSGNQESKNRKSSIERKSDERVAKSSCRDVSAEDKSRDKKSEKDSSEKHGHKKSAHGDAKVGEAKIPPTSELEKLKTDSVKSASDSKHSDMTTVKKTSAEQRISHGKKSEAIPQDSPQSSKKDALAGSKDVKPLKCSDKQPSGSKYPTKEKKPSSEEKLSVSKPESKKQDAGKITKESKPVTSDQGSNASKSSDPKNSRKEKPAVSVEDSTAGKKSDADVKIKEAKCVSDMKEKKLSTESNVEKRKEVAPAKISRARTSSAESNSGMRVSFEDALSSVGCPPQIWKKPVKKKVEPAKTVGGQSIKPTTSTPVQKTADPARTPSNDEEDDFILKLIEDSVKKAKGKEETAGDASELTVESGGGLPSPFIKRRSLLELPLPAVDPAFPNLPFGSTVKEKAADPVMRIGLPKASRDVLRPDPRGLPSFGTQATTSQGPRIPPLLPPQGPWARNSPQDPYRQHAGVNPLPIPTHQRPQPSETSLFTRRPRAITTSYVIPSGKAQNCARNYAEHKEIKRREEENRRLQLERERQMRAAEERRQREELRAKEKEEARLRELAVSQMDPRRRRSEDVSSDSDDKPFTSPLVSLYGTVAIPKTGRGYGKQSFKIPKKSLTPAVAVVNSPSADQPGPSKPVTIKLEPVKACAPPLVTKPLTRVADKKISNHSRASRRDLKEAVPDVKDYVKNWRASKKKQKPIILESDDEDSGGTALEEQSNETQIQPCEKVVNADPRRRTAEAGNPRLKQGIDPDPRKDHERPGRKLPKQGKLQTKSADIDLPETEESNSGSRNVRGVSPTKETVDHGEHTNLLDEPGKLPEMLEKPSKGTCETEKPALEQPTAAVEPGKPAPELEEPAAKLEKPAAEPQKSSVDPLLEAVTKQPAIANILHQFLALLKVDPNFSAQLEKCSFPAPLTILGGPSANTVVLPEKNLVSDEVTSVPTTSAASAPEATGLVGNKLAAASTSFGTDEVSKSHRTIDASNMAPNSENKDVDVSATVSSNTDAPETTADLAPLLPASAIPTDNVPDDMPVLSQFQALAAQDRSVSSEPEMPVLTDNTSTAKIVETIMFLENETMPSRSSDSFGTSDMPVLTEFDLSALDKLDTGSNDFSQSSVTSGSEAADIPMMEPAAKFPGTPVLGESREESSPVVSADVPEITKTVGEDVSKGEAGAVLVPDESVELIPVSGSNAETEIARNIVRGEPKEKKEAVSVADKNVDLIPVSGQNSETEITTNIAHDESKSEKESACVPVESVVPTVDHVITPDDGAVGPPSESVTSKEIKDQSHCNLSKNEAEGEEALKPDSTLAGKTTLTKTHVLEKVKHSVARSEEVREEGESDTVAVLDSVREEDEVESNKDEVTPETDSGPNNDKEDVGRTQLGSCSAAPGPSSGDHGQEAPTKPNLTEKDSIEKYIEQTLQTGVGRQALMDLIKKSDVLREILNISGEASHPEQSKQPENLADPAEEREDANLVENNLDETETQSQEISSTIVANVKPVKKKKKKAKARKAKSKRVKPTSKYTTETSEDEVVHQRVTRQKAKLTDFPVPGTSRGSKQNTENDSDMNESVETSDTCISRDSSPASMLKPQPSKAKAPSSKETVRQNVPLSKKAKPKGQARRNIVVDRPNASAEEVHSCQPELGESPTVEAKRKTRKKTRTELDWLHEELGSVPVYSDLMNTSAQRSCRVGPEERRRGGSSQRGERSRGRSCENTDSDVFEDEKLHSAVTVRLIRLRGSRNVARRGGRRPGCQPFRQPVREASPPLVPGGIILIRNMRKAIRTRGLFLPRTSKPSIEEIVKNLKPLAGRWSLAGKRLLPSLKLKNVRKKQLGSVIALKNGRVVAMSDLKRYAFSGGEELMGCLLCEVTGMKPGQVSKHYKDKHADSEVLISRLPVPVAQRAINEGRRFASSEGAEPPRRRKEQWTCRMCGVTLPAGDEEQLFLHVSEHTGEYRWQCAAPDCEATALTRESLRSHADFWHYPIRKKLLNSEKELFPVPSEFGHIFGYLCTRCNFVQTMRRNVEYHVSTLHPSVVDAVDIVKIDMFSRTDEKPKVPVPPPEPEVEKETVDKRATLRIRATPTPPVSPKKQPPKKGRPDTVGGTEEAASKRLPEESALKRPPDEPVAGPSKRRAVAKKGTGSSAMKLLKKKFLEDKLRTYHTPQRRPKTTPIALTLGPLRVKSMPNGVTLFECMVKQCIFSASTMDLFERHVETCHFRTRWNYYCSFCEATLPPKPSDRCPLSSALAHIRCHVKNGVLEPPTPGGEVSATPPQHPTPTEEVLTTPTQHSIPSEEYLATPLEPAAVVVKTEPTVIKKEPDVAEVWVTPQLDVKPVVADGARYHDNATPAAPVLTPEAPKVDSPRGLFLRVKALEGDILSTHSPPPLEPSASITSTSVSPLVCTTIKQMPPPTATGVSQDMHMDQSITMGSASPIIRPIGDQLVITRGGPTPNASPREPRGVEIARRGLTYIAPKPEQHRGVETNVTGRGSWPVVSPPEPKAVEINVVRRGPTPIAPKPGEPRGGAISSTRRDSAPDVSGSAPEVNAPFPQISNVFTMKKRSGTPTPSEATSAKILAIFGASNVKLVKQPELPPPEIPKKTGLASVKPGGSVLASIKPGGSVLASIKPGGSVLASIKPGGNVQPSVKPGGNANASIIVGATVAPSTSSVQLSPLEGISDNTWRNTKNPEVYRAMLEESKLAELYKCMGTMCSFTGNIADVFQKHCELHEFAERNGPDHAWRQCAYCRQQFGPQELANHIRVVHGPSPFQCGYCFYRALKSTYVQNHQQVAHRGEPFVALNCIIPPGANTTPLPPDKTSQKNWIRPYTCVQCNTRFKKTKEFARHMLDIHPEGPFPCPMCKHKNIATVVDLIEHYKQHNINTYQCGYCLHGAETQPELMYHLCNFHFDRPPHMYLRDPPEEDDEPDYAAHPIQDYLAGNEPTLGDASTLAELIRISDKGTSLQNLLPNAEFSSTPLPAVSFSSSTVTRPIERTVNIQDLELENHLITVPNKPSPGSVPLGQMDLLMRPPPNILSKGPILPKILASQAKQKLAMKMGEHQLQQQQQQQKIPKPTLTLNLSSMLSEPALEPLPPDEPPWALTPITVGEQRTPRYSPRRDPPDLLPPVIRVADFMDESLDPIADPRADPARDDDDDDGTLDTTARDDDGDKTPEDAEKDTGSDGEVEIIEVTTHCTIRDQMASLRTQMQGETESLLLDEVEERPSDSDKAPLECEDTLADSEGSDVLLLSPIAAAVSSMQLQLEREAATKHQLEVAPPEEQQEAPVPSAGPQETADLPVEDPPDCEAPEEAPVDPPENVSEEEPQLRSHTPKDEVLIPPTKSRSDLYKCGNGGCTFAADTSNELREHLVICNLDVQLGCPFCSFVTKSADNYVAHLQKHSGKRFSCARCLKRTHQAGMITHVRSYHKCSSYQLTPKDLTKTDIDNDLFMFKPIRLISAMDRRKKANRKPGVKTDRKTRGSVTSASRTPSPPEEAPSPEPKRSSAASSPSRTPRRPPSTTPEPSASPKRPSASPSPVLTPMAPPSTTPEPSASPRRPSAAPSPVLVPPSTTPEPAATPRRPPATPSPVQSPMAPPAARTLREPNTYYPEDEALLPMSCIFAVGAKCGICSFTNKVRSNMVRHLKLHTMSERLGVVVPSSAPTNPVPCLEGKDKMFDKMTNLAASSLLDRVPVENLTAADRAKMPPAVPDQKRFQCGDCRHITLDENMLLHHITALHSELSTYSCPHCPSGMAEALRVVPLDQMAQHLKHHDTKLFKCAHCDFFHFLKQAVEKHLSDTHPERRHFVHTIREPTTEPEVTRVLKCVFCSYSTLATPEMVLHLRRAHEVKGKYKCKECTFGSKSVGSFAQHFSSCHGGRKPRWEKCYIIVKEASQRPEPEAPEPSPEADTTPLWQRGVAGPRMIRGIPIDADVEVSGKQRRQSGERTYRCIICSYATPQESEFRQHLYNELNYVQFVCNLCTCKFFTQDDAAKHNNAAHPNQDAIVPAEAKQDVDAFIDACIDKQTAEMGAPVKRNKRKSDGGGPETPKKAGKRQAEASSVGEGTRSRPGPSRVSDGSLIRVGGSREPPEEPKEQETPLVEDRVRVADGAAADRVPRSLLQCPHCLESQRSVLTLKTHITCEHLRLGRFECQHCSRTFITETLAKRHGYADHGDEAATQPNARHAWFALLDEFWKAEYSLTEQLKAPCVVTDHLAKSVVCSRCAWRGPQLALDAHNASAHRLQDGVWRCEISGCSYSSRSEEELLAHDCSHSWKLASIPGQSVTFIYDLTYFCGECGAKPYKCASESAMILHAEASHSQGDSLWENLRPNTLLCCYCMISTHGREHAWNHWLEAHSPQDLACVILVRVKIRYTVAKYCCPTCKFTNTCLTTVEAHMENHNERIVCGDCPATFLLSSDLEGHQALLNHTKPFTTTTVPTSDLRHTILVERSGKLISLAAAKPYLSTPAPSSTPKRRAPPQSTSPRKRKQLLRPTPDSDDDDVVVL